jgi:hypothetical protein
VVEYMVAKFADIPCVILRTDFRGAGDQNVKPSLDLGVGKGEGGVGGGGEQGQGDSWNLMSSFWPRTKSLSVDSMAVYKTSLAQAMKDGSISLSECNALAGEVLMREVAERVVKAMEEVVQIPPRMPRELRGSAYEWLSLMVGWRDGGDEENVMDLRRVLDGKVEKGLL